MYARNKLYVSKKYIQEKGIPQIIKELENHSIVGFIDKDKCQNILVGFSEQDNILVKKLILMLSYFLIMLFMILTWQLNVTELLMFYIFLLIVKQI